MKNRLFIKILATYLLITLFLSTVILISSVLAGRNSSEDYIAPVLSGMSKTTAAAIAPYIGNDPTRLDDTVRDVVRGSDVRIVVIDPRGDVLIDSADEPLSQRGLATGPGFVSALGGTTVTYRGPYGSSDGLALVAASPIVRGDKIVGVVMLSRTLDDGTAPIPKSVLVVTALSVIFCSAVGAVALWAYLSRPIAQLGDAAKRVAAGNFTARVFLGGDDEIKDLADRFNYMTERIDFLFHQVLGKKDELLQIISSIEEAILVVDAGGRIVLFNEGFERIAHDRPSPGKYYWESTRDLKIGELIEAVRRNKKPVRTEARIEGRIFASGVSYIDSADEIVMALYDITDIRRLEEDKKEFVTNIAHELRTPLTAVKGFVETLSTANDEKKPYYLDVIMRNTDRMIDIIEDLSLLSESEERRAPLKTESIDVKETIQDIVTMFEGEASRKGLTMAIDAPEGALLIRADRFRIERLFTNLIDNAVKYTQAGEVTITLRLTDGVFTAAVRDTGIGIPKHDIPRIFDRFYRVDKSRSRRLGGTGLGLSIVREIVLLHGGELRVESAVGVGSTFTVSLPQGGRA